ncbi:MAG: endolytic transglycosylase MltG [Cyclobacteriaceae bacterium]
MDRKKIVAVAMIVSTIMLSSFSFYIYQVLYTANILVDTEDRYVAIKKETSFDELQNLLYDQRIVNDLVSFSFLAKVKGLDERVRGGMYLFKKNMSNNDAINMLRAGLQSPVKMTFNSARKIEDLAAKLTINLEIDSASMAPYLSSDSIARAYGFDSLNFISMFLPNTYEVYWTSQPKDILDRMKAEYDRFWNDERKSKADSLGLTPLEVTTLASIVDSETNLMKEAPTIAGVYLNRIKRGYPLQADPTLVFAIGDFTIQRVLDVHKRIDSPYNTYKYRGLPPGPIMMPSLKVVEAVLNAENHRFLYFCVNEDLSGYHVFASTLVEHNKNAKKLHRALNQRRIYR